MVLCSGYVSSAREIPQIAPQIGSGSASPVRLPSLHVYGSSDRQLRAAAPCAALAAAFAPETRVVVEHTQGHIVPASAKFVEQYAASLTLTLTLILALTRTPAPNPSP